MSTSVESLRNKMAAATELNSVVRTMKAMAAAAIGQYERSVAALDSYERTIEQGLTISLRGETFGGTTPQEEAEAITGVVVFGADQGLVGRFNDAIGDLLRQRFPALPGEKRVWVIGTRLYEHLRETSLPIAGQFPVPGSLAAITPLVGDILAKNEGGPLHIFHNRPLAQAAYEPVFQQLLPLDLPWMRDLAQRPWPTQQMPEVLGERKAVLGALVRQHLFIRTFRAASESLAAENAARLAAMQKAEENIADMLAEMQQAYHHLRQQSIDEELFDVIAGFEALRKGK